VQIRGRTRKMLLQLMTHTKEDHRDIFLDDIVEFARFLKELKRTNTRHMLKKSVERHQKRKTNGKYR
jgi:hypothetical protein